MNHLDEGTIHAWLDGALDAAQSAEIDTHVKTCAECSAKVAEARGLIAASSRILVSLDDVPANVIPKKAPVAPKRPRRMAPWVSGLAAAAILVTLWRTSGVEQPTARSEINVPEIRVVTGLPEPGLTELKVDVLPPPSPVTVLPRAVEQRQSKVANTPRLADGRGAAGAGAVGGVSASAASDLASAQTATAPAAAPPVEANRMALQREESLKDEALTVVGCYRFSDNSSVPFEAVAVTGAADARAPEKAARARGAVTSAAPAPAAVQKRADADVVQGVVVRLDAQRMVRAIGSDSIMGSWAHFRADSARVQLGSRSGFVGSSNKVRCP